MMPSHAPAKEIKAGEDLHLRLLRQDSSPVIYNAINLNRQQLRKWLPFVDSTRKLEDTAGFVRSIIRPSGPRHDIVYEIWHDKDFAGLIAFKETDYFNNKTEIGYWLDPRFQGKGIMTRSCKALIDYAFSKMGINRVQVKVGIGNARSSMIPERLGFSFEGIERCGEKFPDHYLNVEIYSMLKEEWLHKQIINP
jgi:ribosomal-protein-serine acetyltransferase